MIVLGAGSNASLASNSYGQKVRELVALIGSPDDPACIASALASVCGGRRCARACIVQLALAASYHETAPGDANVALSAGLTLSAHLDDSLGWMQPGLVAVPFDEATQRRGSAADCCYDAFLYAEDVLRPDEEGWDVVWVPIHVYRFFSSSGCELCLKTLPAPLWALLRVRKALPRELVSKNIRRLQSYLCTQRGFLGNPRDGAELAIRLFFVAFGSAPVASGIATSTAAAAFAGVNAGDLGI